jgi:hypothetical protein
VSEEHWLDNLARRYSRRTILKAALAGGVALTLPQSRVPLARATGNEPCYKPCVRAAGRRGDSALAACNNVASNSLALAGLHILYGNVAVAAALTIAADASHLGCRSAAMLTFHRDVVACGGARCGNSGGSSGGKAPANSGQCPPDTTVACGDGCCGIAYGQCIACKDGTYKCCSNTEAQPCC